MCEVACIVILLFAYMHSNSAVAVSNRVVEVDLACKKNLFIVKYSNTKSLKYKSLQIFKVEIL